MTIDVIGLMLSVPVDDSRMPRFPLNTAIYVSKLGQKLARNEWCFYPALVNNSWEKKNQVSYEPITGVDRSNVLSIQECSSTDWNAESGVNTLNMSQHCHVINANSKQ